MFEERRINRSNEIHQALRFLLSASASRAHFHSLVLSNEDGLLIADTGNQESNEELAALSPQLTSESTFWQGVVDTQTGSKFVTVTCIPTDCGPVYLSAVGGFDPGIKWELFNSGRSVKRILS